MKDQKAQALVELLLLVPLFLAFVLALLFFVRILNARLTLIHVCRDTALALGRDQDTDDPQALLQELIQRRGLQGLGRWSAQVQASLPGDAKVPARVFGGILGSLVAEKLSVNLELPPPRWVPSGYAASPWSLTETVTFKRGTWKADYAQIIKNFMAAH